MSTLKSRRVPVIKAASPKVMILRRLRRPYGWPDAMPVEMDPTLKAVRNEVLYWLSRV